MIEPLLVLLLESDETTGDRIQDQLERDTVRAFSLLHVATLARALDVLAANETAVILLDLDLPDAQGLDLFLSLRQNAPFVPIVAFAEFFDAKRARDVIRAGAEDYLTRSQVLSSQLARALEFAIERHALHSAKMVRAEQLQFSEARFRLLINENPDAVLVVNRAHLIRFANPAALALLGKPWQELTGSLFELVPLVDGKQYSIMRAAGPVAIKMRVVEAIWHGENVFIVSLLDVSAERAELELLRARIERYRALIQASPEGILNLESGADSFFTSAHALDGQALAAQAATAQENTRLQAQVQQRAQEFAVLYDLTRELGMAGDLDTLLETLVERAMKLLNAPSGALALYLPDVRQLEPRVLRGSSHTAPSPRLGLGEGLFGRVALSQQTVVLDDYRKWEHRINRSDGVQASAIVAVPMLFGGELVGVLGVHEEGDTTRRFTLGDVQLLTLLAMQAAALVHNARLHQETEKRAGQMALLYDAGLTLNSVLEPEIQLDFLTRIAMRTVRAEFAAFFRYDEATNELVLAFGLGYSDELPYTYHTRIPLSSEKGIEAWVARERLPANLSDVHADDRFAESNEHLMSGVWVPIEHDNRLLGVLGVGSTRVRGFDSYDERLLQLYASQAAVALENARLFQDVRQENERRTILHRASQEIIGAGLDAEQVYAAIHRASARLMRCEAFVIALLDETGDRVNLPYVYDRQGRKPTETIHKTQGLAGYVLSRGETVLIGKGGESGSGPDSIADSEPGSSVLAVPLRHGGQVFGMLSVQSYRQNAYSSGDRVLLEMLAAYAAAALMNVRGAELRLQELERNNLETALALAKAIDARDTYTGAHSDRSAALAAALAQKLNLGAEEAYAVRLGARLHDIGKIGVPDDILRKPGALTEQEWALMKRHPEIGAEILALVHPLYRVIPIVKHHQEWYDGSGYPDGLAGEEIPLGARILAVVDAFSAMTDDRSYRRGISRQAAFAELKRCAGTQFDPRIVAAFLKLWSAE